MEIMKKRLIKFALLSMFFVAGQNLLVHSQPPPPPGEGVHNQQGDIPEGGTAPIGSGVVLLIGLAAAYGGKKIYNMSSEKEIVE